MELLNSLDVSSLEELKEYVSKEVKNANLRKRQIKEIEYVMRKIQSSGSESGRLFAPLDGTSAGSCSTGYNLWRVLRVAVVTPLSPGRVLRDMSVLKRILVSGQVGRPKIGVSSCHLKAGAMTFPKTACWGWESLKGGLQIPQPSKLVQFCTV